MSYWDNDDVPDGDDADNDKRGNDDDHDDDDYAGGNVDDGYDDDDDDDDAEALTWCKNIVKMCFKCPSIILAFLVGHSMIRHLDETAGNNIDTLCQSGDVLVVSVFLQFSWAVKWKPATFSYV